MMKRLLTLAVIAACSGCAPDAPAPPDPDAVRRALEAMESKEIQEHGRQQAICYTCLLPLYEADPEAARRLLDRVHQDQKGM